MELFVDWKLQTVSVTENPDRKKKMKKNWSVNLECNMRNIFLGKSYTKCDGETSPRLFSEKSRLSISLVQ